MNLATRGVTARDWGVATGLAIATVAFAALIQLESYVLYARTEALSADAAFLVAFPFLFVDALVLGALFGGAYLLAKAQWLRVGVAAVALIANAWAIVNQAAYGILRHNISAFDPDVSLTTLPGATPLLAGSISAAAGWLMGMNVLALVAAALWVRRRGRIHGERGVIPPLRLTPLLLAGVAYGAISVMLPRVIDVHGLERHAVVALLTPTETGIAARSIDPSFPDSLLTRLAFGTVPSDSSSGWLSEVVARARALRRPNVVFVVLESVGADQLFPHGRADSTLTPVIARLARTGVVFPNVYAISPATTYAHVPMMTGGTVMSWGSVSEYFRHPYQGATLPAELRKLGYRTGLFAATDLGFAELGRFYRLLPWDTLVHFATGPGPLDERQRVHAWGVNEDHLWTHAKRWVEAERKPFFLNFQTISTHFPYGTPVGFRGPYAATDAASRYGNALAYTDAVLGRVLADIEKRGELERTIVVITGDHGEAFADRHPQNMTHRNYVYDENVRSFLLFAVPGVRGPIVSPRLGTHADLMPSLLALLGTPTAVSGQNLFSPQFSPRLVFFYKRPPPVMWGLRDGHWKFSDRIAGGVPELFDLERDPLEATNVAGQRVGQVAMYRALLREWYARTDRDFVAHLGGFKPSGDSVTTEQALYGGIRDVRIGTLSTTDPDDFTEKAVLQRGSRPTVNVRWLSLERETAVRVRMVSPSRRFWVYVVVIPEPWSSARVVMPFTVDEPGRWTADVWLGPRRLGRAVVDVP
jgi:arylsulfatase A-like enzyme